MLIAAIPTLPRNLPRLFHCNQDLAHAGPERLEGVGV